jgi:hypothetical protein
MAKQESFRLARTRLYLALKDAGWTVSKTTLKTLWAEPPGGEYRISFHAQAIYLGAHSLFLEMRDLPVQDLIRAAEHRNALVERGTMLEEDEPLTDS